MINIQSLFIYLIKYILIIFTFCISGLCLAQNDNESSLSISSQEIAIETMLDKARTSLQKTDYEASQKIINGAIEIAQDSLLYARTQLLQAELYIMQNQFNLANKKIKKIEKLIPEKSFTRGWLQLLQASLHIKNKKYVKANQVLNNVKLFRDKYIDTNFKEQLSFLKAQLSLKIGKLDKAINNFKEILPKLNKQQQHYYEAEATLGLATAYFEKQKLDEANITADKAIEISNKYGFTLTESETYNLKASIARGQSNFEKSLEYIDRYLELKEPLNIDNEQRGAVAIRDQEIDSLNAQLSQKQKDLDRHDYTNIMFFVLLTLLSLLTMSLFKNNKFRLGANKTLVVKNKSLIEERDRAQDAAKIKADFLSTITHELRTPMYAVTGLTHLLLENTPRADQKQHLETLQSSGEYLLSLIDNILNFNKLEANKVELESIPFSLSKRVKDLINSLENQAIERNNKLQLEFDNSIPSRIKGDPVKVSQILINLIGNAIKFTQNGNVWIRANKIKQIDNRCLVRFEIEDNGKGISEEKQVSIFENFAQEESSTTREYGGTGLGLAIVKNLIELMNSDIKLDSKLGRGSIFSFDIWFELPDSNKFYEEHKSATTIIKSDEIIIEPEIIDIKETLDSSSLEVNIRKEIISKKQPGIDELINKKILVVEDNKINQMITRKILEGKSFKCDVANHGAEALQKIQEFDYDLILMDIHMPVMDGKQATMEIRKLNREIPIIALTAATLNDSEKELYEIGFDDVIPKPFKMEDFFEKIQKAFTNYQVL